MADLDGLLDLVPALRERRSVAELAGGLTNTNYKVDDREGAYVVRVSAKDAGLLADRPRERVPEHGRGRRRRCRARRSIDYLPEQSLLVLEFIVGDDADVRGHAARRQARLGRRRVPAPARRPALPRRLQHVRHPAPVSAAGAGPRVPASRPLPRVRAAGAPDRGGDGRARRGHRALQQRPPGRELHRRRRRVPADRLRVLGR